jgi:DNA polymerase-3 subunit gamma/tau
MVLNGFAEFIRNLLVCKDERAVGLLEVVESFKDKYISAAKGVSPALLISALNILNEAEINYKAARNKRLHVELALIKLCYLQQAIELSADANGISKKKIVETAKPVAFRQIIPLVIGSSSAAEGLPQAMQELGVGNRESEVRSKKTITEAKLIIEMPVIEKTKVAENDPLYKQPPATSSRISALDKIRRQYQGTDTNGNENTSLTLKEDTLQKAWAEYVQIMKEAKNPGAQSFELALLRIKDDNSFEAVTSNNIEQKFIEQERNKLFHFLRQKLENRLLQFSVIIEENAELKPKIEPTLNSTQQFQKMAEQYPLVKELKDRLRLELDY